MALGPRSPASDEPIHGTAPDALRGDRGGDASDHRSRPRRRSDGAAPPEIGEPSDVVDRLLDDSWSGHATPYDGRQLVVGSCFSLSFLAAAATLAAAAPLADPRGSWLMIGALVVAFAIASRVEFPIGAGYAVPTQLFLIPLFVAAPPTLVPLLVLAAQTAAGAFDVVAGRARADRLVDVGVDAWHALAPAVVLALAGPPGLEAATLLWLLPCAFAAQVVTEVCITTMRLWLGSGIPPTLQLRVLGTVWGIDFLLTPIALIAAVASTYPGLAAAPLALLGFIVLLALLTRDRTQRIDQAHGRLDALRIERSRLEVAVQRIGDAFASRLDLDALLQITMRAAVEALAADAARASAQPGAGGALVRRATANERPAFARAIEAAEQGVIERRQLSFAEVDGVFAVACPVQEVGCPAIAGVIVLARSGEPFSARKVSLLQYLCDQAGVAAADIERHRTLRRHALTDELTGLANHRRLQEVLAVGADEFATTGAPLALILLDLDDFKKVNDTCGHQTGDHVLRSVSDVLRGCCRADDVAARYGGEELAIVMAAATVLDAVALAERARGAIERLELVDTAGRHLSVTTSVGVAVLGPGITDPASLIAAADAALYDAKGQGKNRVCARRAPARVIAADEERDPMGAKA